MTHSGGCYFFLSRPRRFGKSLLVSTFESYFSGKKELFEGLAIEKLEQKWMEYPVLHFDMSGGKHMEKEQLEDYLSNRLEAEERKWGITHSKRGANDRLTELITTAYEISGKQVVVLIDEYDAPMLAKNAHLRELGDASQEDKTKHGLTHLEWAIEIAHHIAKLIQSFSLMSYIEHRRIILVDEHDHLLATNFISGGN